jgi:hypothetical protein
VTAPTEEEIRAALARAWERRHLSGGWPANAWSEGWGDLCGMGSAPYDLDDLRESEIERLDELVYDAIDPIQTEARQRAIEALVGAMLQFAQEHPDAPRAKRQLTEV